MMDIDAYGPFPNAILFNWATIFVLGFGNLAALDFQVCAPSGCEAATACCKCLQVGPRTATRLFCVLTPPKASVLLKSNNAARPVPSQETTIYATFSGRIDLS